MDKIRRTILTAAALLIAVLASAGPDLKGNAHSVQSPQSARISQGPQSPQSARIGQDSESAPVPMLRASLITCHPGPEIYELCGHEAIRINGFDEKGEYVDSVWNYGVFDFATPNFAYRFAKGETDYIVLGYPFAYFLPEYVRRGSKVVEQTLNLSPEEVARLRKLLQENALPQNRTYRYNYVRDNCSTRVVDIVEKAVAPRAVKFSQEVEYASFRDAMRHFHRNYPWYQLGIDLALGSGIDTPISSREEMFAPVLLERKAAGAEFEDGTPLISRTTTLNEGLEDATLPPTPWLMSAMSASLLLLLISLGVCIWEWRRKRVAKIWMSLFFTLLGVGGVVVWFLVFVSTHDSTSPNLLFLWLNPLQLVMAVCVWWRRTAPAAVAMAAVNLIVLAVLACVWPLQAQSANPAVFPLWGATAALSAVYAIIYPRLSYNIEGIVRNRNEGKVRNKTMGRGAGRNKKTK